MLTISRILVRWFPLAVVVFILAGLTYGVAQQILRQSANDPQIQIAEDVAAALSGGQAIETAVPAGKVDIGTSLAPFLVIYDESGKPIAGSGYLHNQLAALPAGVFDYVRQNGEDRISWQPEAGVRSASVVTSYRGARSGFVMAGRSLREVEIRESNMLQLSVAGGLVAEVAALVAVTLAELLAGARGATTVQRSAMRGAPGLRPNAR